MPKSDLVIVCEHLLEKGKRGYHWSEDKEILLCDPCWKKTKRLQKKHNNDIPNNKLDYIYTICRDCIKRLE